MPLILAQTQTSGLVFFLVMTACLVAMILLSAYATGSDDQMSKILELTTQLEEADESIAFWRARCERAENELKKSQQHGLQLEQGDE